MHNGPALEGMEATLDSGVPLVAALDTAYHATLPPRAWRYALPEIAGVRRYGFHGWSHRYVTERYAALTGSSEPTIVTLHLGGGCSAAAILRGRSVDTSMGYSPLEGLVMGTRAGDLDPGILTHLLYSGTSLPELDHLLQHEAGLKALAGTADVRELLGRDDAAAELALELFCYRIQKCVGAYLAALEGGAPVAGVTAALAGRHRGAVAVTDAPSATPTGPGPAPALGARGARQCRGAIQKGRQASEGMDWVG